MLGGVPVGVLGIHMFAICPSLMLNGTLLGVMQGSLSSIMYKDLMEKEMGLLENKIKNS